MSLLVLVGCWLSLMVNISKAQTVSIDYDCQDATIALVSYSRDNGTNWALTYYGWGTGDFDTTKSWSNVDAEFALKMRCRGGTATTTITYDDGNNQTNDTVIEAAYSGWYYFYFSSILGGDGADSLQPPCGDAVVSFFGTYSAQLSVNGGANYDAITTGSISWWTNGEYYSGAQLTVSEVEADNILKIRSFDGYPVIATVVYNDWYYSTANSSVTVEGANDTVDGPYIWELVPTDTATTANVSFYNKTALSYMVANETFDQSLFDGIQADAQWVDYVSDSDGTFNLVFNFSNLVRDVGTGTCSPTPSPTASPTNSPTAATSNPTTSPTSEPTPSPTYYCELRNEATNPPTSTPSTIDLTSAPSSDPYASVLSAISDSVIADLTCTDSSSLHMFSFLAKLAENSAVNAVFPGTADTNFLDALFCRTQESNYYGDLEDFVASFPVVFDHETECEIDYNLRDLAVYFTWFLNFDNLYSNVNPQTAYLEPMYEELVDIIAAFNSSLTADEAQTAIAITYSFEFCTDWGFDWCVSVGYGFAFDFLGNVMYYKTGSQGMTLWSYDFSLLNLAASVSVSYDVTQNINNVAGSSYSVDLAVESATTILDELADYFTGYDKLDAWGYGISFVLGADSLALDDLDTATCIGFSFSYKLQGISGSLSPSVSFGVSRAYTEEYSELVAKKGSLESNVCVNEQLFSWSSSASLPVIDITLSA